MKGGRFRLGGCADVCQGMGKKENEIQSNQPSLTFLNHTIPNSHSKIFENDWLDWIGWFKVKQKTANLHLSVGQAPQSHRSAEQRMPPCPQYLQQTQRGVSESVTETGVTGGSGRSLTST
jgi:hypothetical protein